MRKVNYKEKGITLVALVITIIILLILAGVTLNSALSQNGLFKRAQDAGEKYKESEYKESKKFNEIVKEMDNMDINYNDYIGAYITGYNPTKVIESDRLEIQPDSSGHTESQYFTTENLEWRIWSYDGKILKIVSATPTEEKLYLNRANGYNNGVFILNEICRKCYTDNKFNGNITVSNLKRSDVASVMKYDYRTAKGHEWSHTYGEWVVTFPNFNKYPKMYEYDMKWNYDEDNIGKTLELEHDLKNETSIVQGNSSTEFRLSHWFYTFENSASNKDFEEGKENYYSLLFEDKERNKIENDYWLSTRSVWLDTSAKLCSFRISRIFTSNGNNTVSSLLVYSSYGNYNTIENGLTPASIRPMISIDLESSGYELQQDKENEVKDFKTYKLVKE